MQSGAFLQLVVTLTALVARLAHLSSAIRSILSTLHAESLLLLSRLHVRSELSGPSPVLVPPIDKLTNDSTLFSLQRPHATWR